MIEAFKEEINKSLKEIQENTVKQVEAFKEKMNKYNGIQENAIKWVKEMNKTVQDLNMEIEVIKKTQLEATLKMENLGKEQELETEASPTEYKR